MLWGSGFGSSAFFLVRLVYKSINNVKTDKINILLFGSLGYNAYLCGVIDNLVSNT